MTTNVMLNTTEIYSLAVLEAVNPNSRCHPVCTPSQRPRGESFLASSDFQKLQEFIHLRLHHSNFCLHLYMAFSSMSVFSSLLSFIRTLVIEFRDHPDNPG